MLSYLKQESVNMQKMLFVFSQGWKSFIVASEYRNNHILLLLLSECLDIITDNYDFRNMPVLDALNYPGIKFYYDKSRDQVNIYHFGSIKKEIDIAEMSDDQYSIYHDLYHVYRAKRYAELPKLVMMAWHWQDLELRWKELLEQKPKYLIMELEDDLPPCKVQMIGKNELSVEDIQYFEQEHEKYLKYQKARQKYIQNHSDYSDDVWRGPQDDEFEADIMKYYEN